MWFPRLSRFNLRRVLGPSGKSIASLDMDVYRSPRGRGGMLRMFKIACRFKIIRFPHYDAGIWIDRNRFAL